jgi:hypothetical protein
MKNAVVWHMMTPRGSCKNRSFGGTYPIHLPGNNNQILPSSHRGCTSRRTRKRTSCNGISIDVSMCYGGDIVDAPSFRLM